MPVMKKSSWSAGELAPTLASRSDIEQWHAGAARLRNVVVIPHGGIRRRPGLLHHAALSYAEAQRTQSVATGTFAGVSELVDYSLVAVTGTPILSEVRVFLWPDDALGCVEVPQAHMTDYTPGTTIRVEGTFFTEILGRDTTTADYWEISCIDAASILPCLYNTTLPAATTTTGIIANQDIFCKTVEFEISDEHTYLMVYTAYLLSIYRKVSGTYTLQTQKLTPYRGQDVSDLTFAMDNDTILSFHKTYPTQKTNRLTHTSWESGPYFTGDPQEKLPEHFFGDSKSPIGTAIPHVETIFFDKNSSAHGWSVGDDQFTITVDGKETTLITHENLAGKASTLTAIEDALEALPTIDVGSVTATHETGTWGIQHTINVTIGTTTKSRYHDFEKDLEIVGSITERGHVGYVNTETRGKPRVEPVWSFTRGYARCGTYFQGRLWMAGSYSLPMSIWGSQSNDYYNFNHEYVLDDSGIFYTLQANRTSTIYYIYPGRHFHIFGAVSEFYIPVSLDTPLTPENFSSRYAGAKGAAPGLRPYDIEGALVYVQRFGKALQQTRFTDTSQSYESESLSQLSNHILSSPVDMSYSSSISSEEADYLYIVNDDGTLAVLNISRTEGVNAWSLCTTQGRFNNAVVVDTDSLFTVWRNGLTNGVPGATSTLHLESFEDDLYVDAAVRVGDNTTEGEAGLTSLFDIAHLDTATAIDIVAGSNDLYRDMGSINTHTDTTVKGDAWSLFASTERNAGGTTVEDDFQAGLRFPVVHGTDSQTLIELFPYESDDSSVRGEVTSIHSLALSLHQTLHLMVGVNDLEPLEAVRLVPSTTTLPNNVADMFAAYEWFTGIEKVSGLQNWDESGIIYITQNKSLPFTLLGLTYKAEV
jgi:hypothetical protein